MACVWWYAPEIPAVGGTDGRLGATLLLHTKSKVSLGLGLKTSTKKP